MTAAAVLVSVAAVLSAGPTSRPAAIQLDWPVKVYHVASGIRQRQLDPSGLYRHRGRLLAVSDKVDSAIFELVLKGDVATMKPYLTLNRDDLTALRGKGLLSRGYLDFEGLTGDGRALYVSAERDRRVLRVDPTGRVRLVGPDLPALHDRLGLRLFDRRNSNAGLEGVCLLGDRLYLANERSRAALLRVRLTGPPRLAWREFRASHLTDLCAHRGRLYALDRLGRQIIEVHPDTLAPVRRYRYARSVALPQYQYAGALALAGMAEGLSIDDRRVYVLLDNNGLALAHNPSDRRSLLFEFSTPAQMRAPAPTSTRPAPPTAGTASPTTKPQIGP